MKQLIGTLAVVVWLAGMPVRASAHDAYDDSESHPLRLVAYAVHPVGFTVEWLVMRPLHFLVSSPQLERITGHVPHENPFGDYRAYELEDYR